MNSWQPVLVSEVSSFVLAESLATHLKNRFPQYNFKAEMLKVWLLPTTHLTKNKGRLLDITSYSLGFQDAYHIPK